MAQTEVKFSYGALSPSLEEQANRQGFTLGKQAERLERIDQARLMLFMNSLISDTVSEKIANRVNEMVVNSLTPIEKEDRP
jgi:hypothetical protein